MLITSDLGRCMGAGQCVVAAETVFDQHDETGAVVLLRAEIDHERELAAVREAVNRCPAGALSLHES
jgi:ferredoxin